MEKRAAIEYRDIRDIVDCIYHHAQPRLYIPAGRAYAEGVGIVLDGREPLLHERIAYEELADRFRALDGIIDIGHHAPGIPSADCIHILDILVADIHEDEDAYRQQQGENQEEECLYLAAYALPRA